MFHFSSVTVLHFRLPGRKPSLGLDTGCLKHNCFKHPRSFSIFRSPLSSLQRWVGSSMLSPSSFVHGFPHSRDDIWNYSGLIFSRKRVQSQSVACSCYARSARTSPFIACACFNMPAPKTGKGNLHILQGKNVTCNLRISKMYGFGNPKPAVNNCKHLFATVKFHIVC